MKLLSNPRTPGGREEAGDRNETCPYLQRAEQTSWYPIEGYCLVPLEGGLRVVTIAEFHGLCTKATYIHCEAYIARQERAQAEGTPVQRGGA